MGFQVGGDSKGPLAQINVTPLVDVMLVLLVIFMVTAPMLSSSKTEVQLPPVDTGETIELDEKKDFILVLTPERQIKIYNCESCRPLSLTELIPTFKENQKLKESRTVYIYADRKLKYRFVLSVMARLRELGVLNVALITDPGNLKAQTTKEQTK